MISCGTVVPNLPRPQWCRLLALRSLEIITLPLSCLLANIVVTGFIFHLQLLNTYTRYIRIRFKWALISFMRPPVVPHLMCIPATSGTAASADLCIRRAYPKTHIRWHNSRIREQLICHISYWRLISGKYSVSIKSIAYMINIFE